jgi:hypothetical protein
MEKRSNLLPSSISTDGTYLVVELVWLCEMGDGLGSLICVLLPVNGERKTKHNTAIVRKVKSGKTKNEKEQSEVTAQR